VGLLVENSLNVPRRLDLLHSYLSRLELLLGEILVLEILENLLDVGFLRINSGSRVLPAESELLFDDWDSTQVGS